MGGGASVHAMRALPIFPIAAAASTCKSYAVGTCATMHCYTFRNSTCNKMLDMGDCYCDPPYTCAVGPEWNGECVLPGSCPRSTPSDCIWAPCPDGQVCVHGSGWLDRYCLCKEGHCVTKDGRCVSED